MKDPSTLKMIGRDQVDIQATRAVVLSVMKYQIQDEVLGTFFSTLYRYCAMLNEKLFEGQLPSLLLSVSTGNPFDVGDTRKASFVSRDGLMLPNRVNLNVQQMQTGENAAEYLTHEAVHAWQTAIGHGNSNNYHDEEWHCKMSEIGLITASRFGDTTGFEPRWFDWIRGECSVLNLRSFKLPGLPKNQQLPIEFSEREEW